MPCLSQKEQNSEAWVTGFLNEDYPFWLGRELIKQQVSCSRCGYILSSVCHTCTILCSDCLGAQVTLYLNRFTIFDLRNQFRFRNSIIRNLCRDTVSHFFIWITQQGYFLSEDRSGNHLLKLAEYCYCSKCRVC